MAGQTAGEPLGLRARNKADKRDRIFAAADRLFTEQGYSAVTTQQIADAAAVGAGTVFRYFPTKADLLVEVMGARLRAGTERARHLAEGGAGAVAAILALVEPLVQAGQRHPDNTAAYQREALFGVAGGDGRGVAEVAGLEAAVEEILARTHPGASPDVRRDAAHAVYATLYVDVVRAALGRGEHDRLRDSLRHHTQFLVAALLAS